LSTEYTCKRCGSHEFYLAKRGNKQCKLCSKERSALRYKKYRQVFPCIDCGDEVTCSIGSRCRVCVGKTKLGENHPNYRGGWFDKCGYHYICVNGEQILEHRFLMETLLGRKLIEEETVHHLNGIRSDNRLENFELVTKYLGQKRFLDSMNQRR